MVLRQYREHAAAERWPDWSLRALRRLAALHRDIERQPAESVANGQPASGLGGIVPVEIVDRLPARTLSPEQALREGGLPVHVGAV
ncbi:hypothetical protein SSBR45G_46580 [Bradyrhizobium sp. SSBR45G]|uniref:hypothetical protein n=1 Tax=unclassified Bradyrhizobium TaxID=2631580 RepID=UPI002342ADA2|nr:MULTISPECIES: hypothetical protein [unclassified Bradyrhizobium]GLH79749.1 hypothetical protein SSBR45G_46580 [Bradyrhizobium sp. SSBR45G]GLH87133.1 hypothetical protein SSBR45R_45930 [Bradyrhizobium sp. SSBR45R]